MRHQTGAGAELTLCSVTKSFGTKAVVRDISLECPTATRLSLLGPSGCGKSTLLRLIVGLEKPDSGEIRINNQPVTTAAIVQHVAYLGQRPALLPWLTALDNAMLPLRLVRPLTKEDRALAVELFDSFGLEGSGKLMPGELSGGMRQRVALVQSLIVGATILILDEPFAALDDITRRSIVSQLHCWIRDHHVSLIMVTHSFEDAAYLSDQVLFWRHGATQPMGSQLHRLSLKHTFTPNGDLKDFAEPDFIGMRGRMFNEYLAVSQEIAV